MKRLSGMDASFLHLETPETPMHVGGMHTLELPAGYLGDFYEDFRRHIANRLHAAASDFRARSATTMGSRFRGSDEVRDARQDTRAAAADAADRGQHR